MEAGLPELNRDEPQYRQLIKIYKQRIISGKMRQGTLFPSVRVLAREWDVTAGVAQHAVEYLKAEKLLYAVPGKGTFVNKPRATFGPQQRARAISFPAFGAGRGPRRRGDPITGVRDPASHPRTRFGRAPS